jgi:hypothetical protein
MPESHFFWGSTPTMFELLTSVIPLKFETCWLRRMTITHDFGEIQYIGLTDLRISKLHAGRTVDLLDLEALPVDVTGRNA